MDREAWQTTVHEVAELDTAKHTHAHIHTTYMIYLFQIRLGYYPPKILGGGVGRRETSDLSIFHPHQLLFLFLIYFTSDCVCGSSRWLGEKIETFGNQNLFHIIKPLDYNFYHSEPSLENKFCMLALCSQQQLFWYCLLYHKKTFFTMAELKFVFFSY